MKTTNYTNTLIDLAEDCPVSAPAPPPSRTKPTIAQRQYDLLIDHPYRYTSDDLLFQIHAERSSIAEADREAERERFFAKSQACLRTSPLPRRYGWCLHHDAEGRVALVAPDSEEYQQIANDPSITRVKAMRTKRG